MSNRFSIHQYRKLEKTTNGGQTWAVMYTSSDFIPEPRVYFLNQQVGFIGVSYNEWNNFYRTSDGGISWMHPTIGNLTWPDITSIFFVI